MEELNCFSLSSDSNIILYGAGYLGKAICQALQKQGYYVWGFIDENAEAIHSVGKINVYTMEDVRKKMSEGKVDRNSIVIVCLQNGLQHEIVADKIYLLGLKNIIFLPMNLQISLKEQSEYRKHYRRVTRYEFEKVKNVPQFGISSSQDKFIIIDEYDDEIIFWCPIQYLRTATKVMIDQRISERLASAITILSECADQEVESCVPYLELMRWLCGDRDSNIEIYLDAMGRVDQTQRMKLLEDRKMLFEIYKRQYQYNIPFFLDSPAMAVWNSKGYFNVEDGLHRIHFLLSKGHREVPVLVKKKEFMFFLEFYRRDSLS